MKTGKTPYEIRLNLLELSSTILTNQVIADLKGKEDFVGNAPTTEQIIAEAQKLNKFVSQGGDKQ